MVWSGFGKADFKDVLKTQNLRILRNFQANTNFLLKIRAWYGDGDLLLAQEK